jgi:hypothetical protein
MDASAGAYFRALLLEEARWLSQEALDRLKELHDRYPIDLPEQVIEGLEHIRPGYQFEQRSFPRLPRHGAKIELCRPETAEPLEEVVMLDHCVGGVGVRCERPLPVGCIVSLSPQQKSDALSPCRAEVRYCRRQKDAWIVGCQFLPLSNL